MRLSTLCLLLSVLALPLSACRPADVAPLDSALGDTEAPEGPPDPLFDPDHVLEVELELEVEDWDSIRNQHRNILELLAGDCMDGPIQSPYSYVQAAATIDGEHFEAIGVRKKGLLGSDNVDKPSLKLNMDWAQDDVAYLGHDMLTFNNANQDPSYLDQCLGYGLFAAAGVPASRCNFAHITVNGADLGLYVQVESIRRPYWEHHVGDDSGNHYEGTLSDFREGWVDTFEAKDGNSDDRSDLQGVVDALDADDDSLLDELGAVLDLEQFYSYWAVEVLTGHWDGYAAATNNFHVYNDPQTGKFLFVPWGIDALFDGQQPFGSTVPESVVARSAVPRRLYEHQAGRAAYQARLEELLDTIWDAEALDAEIDRMVDLVSPYIQAHERAAFDDGVATIRAYVPERQARIRDELAAGAPDWGEPLRSESCLEDVGGMSGNFSTAWGSLEDDALYGDGDMKVEYYGDDIPLGQIISLAGEDQGQAMLAVLGVLGPNTYIYPWFMIPMGALEPGAELAVDWNEVRAYAVYVEGNHAGIMGYIGDGTLSFDEVGTETGDAVTGSFDVRIFGGAVE
jgi:hypothetical protein